LNENGEGLLNDINYYSMATIYRLVAPLATYRLLRDKLTSIDLELDAHIKKQYLLLKTLYYTFADDSRLAKYHHPIDYDYYAGESDRQGIRRGEIDNMVDSLIIENKQGKHSIMNFGNFQKYFFPNTKCDLEIEECPFIKFYSLIKNFHPKNKPVLWRILLAQSYIYFSIMKLHQTQNYKEIKIIKDFPVTEKSKLNWIRATGNSYEEYKESFDAAEKYLAEKLPEFV